MTKAHASTNSVFSPLLTKTSQIEYLYHNKILKINFALLGPGKQVLFLPNKSYLSG